MTCEIVHMQFFFNNLLFAKCNCLAFLYYSNDDVIGFVHMVASSSSNLILLYLLHQCHEIKESNKIAHH